MRIVSMRTVAGEAPAIIAEPGPGESPAVGQRVNDGGGTIVMVTPAPAPTEEAPEPRARVFVRAVEVITPERFTERPADLPEDQPFVPVSLGPPESLGFVLARRIRDGLRTLTIDGGI